MAQVLVRNLDDKVKRRICIRAARHGHSMEQETRAILSQAVEAEAKTRPTDSEGLGTRIARRFAGIGFTEAELIDTNRALSQLRWRSDKV